MRGEKNDGERRSSAGAGVFNLQHVALAVVLRRKAHCRQRGPQSLVKVCRAHGYLLAARNAALLRRLRSLRVMAFLPVNERQDALDGFTRMARAMSMRSNRSAAA